MRRTASALAPLGALLVLSASAEADVRSYVPTDDARAHQSSPTSKYGTSSTLRTDYSTTAQARSFLKFTVADAGAVSSAKLRVWATGKGHGPAAFSSSDLTWSERSVTWATRPTAGTRLAGGPATAPSGAWVEFDVSAAVKQDGQYSFVLAPDTSDTDGVWFESKEHSGGHKPQLVVTTGSPPPEPEPTPTDPEPTPTDPEPTPTDPEPTPTDPQPTPTDPDGGGSTVFDPMFQRRPYTAASPWNTPIGPNPTVNATSKAGVSMIGGPITSDTSQYSYPLYLVDDTTKTGKVTLSGTYSDVTGTATEDQTLKHLRGPGLGITVPLRDEFSPAVGTDGQIIIVNPKTGDEWGFWQLKKDSTGAWTATNGYHYNVYWDGHPPRSASGSAFGSRGAGVTYYSGLVRPYEVKRGRIDHALAFAYGGDSWPSTKWIYPASKSDGKSTDPDSLPEGARLQLDPAVTESDLRARGCSQAAIVIARALQEYGMFVIDNSRSDKILLEYNGTADWSSMGVGRNTASCIPLDRVRWVK